MLRVSDSGVEYVLDVQLERIPHQSNKVLSKVFGVQIVAADIMGPLPTSKNANHYLLAVSDYSIKWVEAYIILNQEATTVAHQLIDNTFCCFSLPEQLHSDMRTQFESQVVVK